MIDLTKPIRYKSNRRLTARAWQPDRNRDLVVIKYDEDDGFAYIKPLIAFEEQFENIPEPLKPREWWLNIHKWGPGNTSFCGHETLTEANSTGVNGVQETIRIIEWPEGAPLPQWPE